METQIILSVINPYILLGVGVALIAFESVLTSFFLIWFGIGFIVTAIISYFYPFSDGLWQLAVVSIISLILVFLLRKKFLEKFLNSKETISDNFLDEKGIGTIRNSKVFYKGTYWEIDTELKDNSFIEEEKVIVLKTYKNFAKIRKK